MQRTQVLAHRSHGYTLVTRSKHCTRGSRPWAWRVSREHQEDTFEPILAQTTFHGIPSRSRSRLRPLPGRRHLLQIQAPGLGEPVRKHAEELPVRHCGRRFAA
jgi:hypothetical protein